MGSDVEVSAIEDGRRGIECSDGYKRPWHEPASSYELAKAAVAAAAPAIRSQERERLKGTVEEAYCVEEFLRKVTAWEGSAEDELAEAIEAAEKLTAALDKEADHV